MGVPDGDGSARRFVRRGPGSRPLPRRVGTRARTTDGVRPARSRGLVP
nr:MAG TPA: hypothetical protein [Caudoviricetes sp.]